jgi:hypothetical protein
LIWIGVIYGILKRRARTFSNTRRESTHSEWYYGA